MFSSGRDTLTMTKAVLIIAAVLLSSTNAFAQDPPGKEQTPVADKGSTAQENCIVENDGYALRNGKPTFVIQLENKCAQRLSCNVYAYVTSPRGVAQGHGTIMLAAKAEGPLPKGTFVMPAKMTRGNSQSDRECKPY
jgi:hypothetical protein